MVRKFLGFFYRESSSLNEAALVLGLFALASQILAFVRDRLLAHIFGAGMELDIYYAAFRIPDFIFVTVASLVSLSVLVPFIIEKDREDKEALRVFIDSIFSFFAIAMTLSAGLAYLLMPYLIQKTYSGFSPAALDETIFLSRFLLLSPVLLGVSNRFGSITQARNRFALYALAPILYNGGIIVGIIFFATKLGILGVALGVVFGALLHASIQLPVVIGEGLLPRLYSLNSQIVKRVAGLSVPRTLTLAMSSLALIFLTSLASIMEEGSIAILSFSNNLQSVPLSIVGVSYSLVAFPTLSRRFLEKNLSAFGEQMVNSARFIIFWSLPFTSLLIILRAQVVRVILGTGLFDWPATRLTAAALALFVLSSVFQSLSLLFMRGFYSAGFTLKPFFINFFGTLILILSSFALIILFQSREEFKFFIEALLRVEDLPGSVVLMLPLGFSFGTILNSLLLWVFFEQEFRGFSAGIGRVIFESLGASVLMGAVTYWALGFFVNLFDTATLIGLFFQALLAGTLGIIGGVVILYLLNSRELQEIVTTLKSRFWKTKGIATDPEIV